MGRVWLLCGCLFAFLFVGLGAFGAHALEPLLNSKQLATLDTANLYLGYHSIALLALGLWSHWEKWASSFLAGIFFVLGICLFSGSLYGMAFTDIEWLAFGTPAGGILFILGWLKFLYSIFNTRNNFI